MGIFDFLRGEKGTPSDKQIKRAVAGLTETHGDPYRRRSAADQLLEWGTPKALRALLQRYTIQASSETVDTEEKKYLHDTLVRLGGRAVGPILQYLHEEKEISYSLSALSKLVKKEQFVEELLKILSELDLRDPRDAPKKVELLRHLRGHLDPRILDAALAHLIDIDDDVRLMAVDILADNGSEEIRTALIRSYLDSSDRPRVRTKVLELYSRAGWAVKGYRRQVEESIPDSYYMTKKGIIVPRNKEN